MLIGLCSRLVGLSSSFMQGPHIVCKQTDGVSYLEKVEGWDRNWYSKVVDIVVRDQMILGIMN